MAMIAAASRASEIWFGRPNRVPMCSWISHAVACAANGQTAESSRSVTLPVAQSTATASVVSRQESRFSATDQAAPSAVGGVSVIGVRSSRCAPSTTRSMEPALSPLTVVGNNDAIS